MRKLLLSVLFATAAATPVAAQFVSEAEERSAAIRERAEARQAVREAREEARSEAPPERAEPRRDSAPRATFAAPGQSGDGERGPLQRRIDVPRGDSPVDAPAWVGGGGNVNERGRPTLPGRGATGGGLPGAPDGDRGGPVFGGEGGETATGWREREPRDPRRSVIDRWGRRGDVPMQPPTGARPDRPAPSPEVETAHRRFPDWRTDWRHDRRYDWRRWRDRDRSRFHLGFYFDPFGWDYHRFGVGWRMWPSYYSHRYWLHDPWSYRLPHAPWPYQWVRYYDDAVLVNTITGRVEDVIYNFFW